MNAKSNSLLSRALRACAIAVISLARIFHQWSTGAGVDAVFENCVPTGN
jgi:hypothetical protein